MYVCMYVYLHLPVQGLVSHYNGGLLEVLAELVQPGHAAHDAALLELGGGRQVFERHAPGPLVHLMYVCICMYVCMYLYILRKYDS